MASWQLEGQPLERLGHPPLATASGISENGIISLMVFVHKRLRNGVEFLSTRRFPDRSDRLRAFSSCIDSRRREAAISKPGQLGIFLSGIASTQIRKIEVKELPADQRDAVNPNKN
ncbi:MAG TPA: hypothetical protein VGL71_02185 [Urbifossiella sp.]|jgi:hypothetical protein